MKLLFQPFNLFFIKTSIQKNYLHQQILIWLFLDEAHRSIGGNKSCAVFEYFIGYKLGLTATPKDYLKKIDKEQLSEKDPRELERRMLMDTYTTFGCADGNSTFRYSLIDGVKRWFSC